MASQPPRRASGGNAPRFTASGRDAARGTDTSGTIRCAVCGTESRQFSPRPVAPEQAPDLDLRPGEPLRSTMEGWLQQCPRCSYAAPEIARSHPATAQAVGAAPFRALVNDTTYPLLARRFLAWGHVLEESGALHAAAEAMLQAAWVADDQEQPELARSWRLDAVALWRSGPPLDLEQSVRVVDALRRAGAWEDAATSARAISTANPPEAAAQVLSLEARLVTARDDGRHTVASALPPPARRPHVTQNRPRAGKPGREGASKGGLLARLRRWLGGR